jgi:hypothetical protein
VSRVRADVHAGGGVGRPSPPGARSRGRLTTIELANDQSLRQCVAYRCRDAGAENTHDADDAHGNRREPLGPVKVADRRGRRSRRPAPDALSGWHPGEGERDPLAEQLARRGRAPRPHALNEPRTATRLEPAGRQPRRASLTDVPNARASLATTAGERPLLALAPAPLLHTWPDHRDRLARPKFATSLSRARTRSRSCELMGGAAGSASELPSAAPTGRRGRGCTASRPWSGAPAPRDSFVTSVRVLAPQRLGATVMPRLRRRGELGDTLQDVGEFRDQHRHSLTRPRWPRPLRLERKPAHAPPPDRTARHPRAGSGTGVPKRDGRLPPEGRGLLAFLGGASSNLGIPTSSLRKKDGRDRYRERYSDPTRSRLRGADSRETGRWRH